MLHKIALLLALLAPAAAGQVDNRKNNDALLGVVTVQKGQAVLVAHVLKDSPASKAGIQVGDRIQRVGKESVKTPIDLDRALAAVRPGEQVKLQLHRKKRRVMVDPNLIAREGYKGSFMRRPPRKTGFKAPDWYGFAWANVAAGKKAPTRENTKGKVVVLHAFQSW